MAVTGLSGEELAPLSALLMGISAFPSGMLVAVIGNGWKSFKRALPPVLILAGVMGTVQYLLATNGLWTLGSTGAGLVGILVGLLLVRLPAYRGAGAAVEIAEAEQDNTGASLWLALFGYGLLVVLAFAVNLIKPVQAFLSRVVLTLDFPTVTTALGWVTEGGPGRKIPVFAHPGAILLYTCLIAYLVYRSTGTIKAGSLPRILNRVLHSGVNSSLGILAMVGVASIMLHSGMTTLLAEGLSVSFGEKVYPAIAPFIGALGAFITGSNTNSNVLFGALQQNSAALLNLSAPLILAAQTAGGSLGSVLAPAKVIVGCSTVGLSGEEGRVMRKLLGYGLITIGTVALAAFLINWFG
jgi:lactate permease